ncbi:MAG: hypothetical protein KatS3mg102_1215 [Planctomycetota bacterium]|nr:MAG: hypothetical protein KatS3mg102_1215 [Planctomycetota bacterium]
MPQVRPFRAILYDPAHAGPIEELLAEPYDKVSPAMRRAYLERNPHNVVRLSLPEPEAPGEDAYAAAAARWRAWLRQGLVRREERPALWWYEQRFAHGGREYCRHGLFALVEAAPYGEGGVLPHERTYGVYKEERLRLLRAVRAHFGVVFLLYEDAQRLVPQVLERAAAATAPRMEFRTPDGIAHRLWAIDDAEAIRTVCAHMAARTCVIADGHHRYETAVAFRQQQEQRGEAQPGHRYRLCALVEVHDPGLLVLATHRVLPEVTLDELLAMLDPLFTEDTVLHQPQAEALEAELQGLAEAGPGCYVLTDGRRAHRVVLRPEVDLDEVLAPLPAPLRRLDVTILHALALEPLLERRAAQGATAEEAALRPWYTRTAAEALARLDERYRVAVLLRPTPPRAVLQVARAGATMPQKSTDFYPKFPSGLLMNDVEAPLDALP